MTLPCAAGKAAGCVGLAHKALICALPLHDPNAMRTVRKCGIRGTIGLQAPTLRAQGLELAYDKGVWPCP